MTGARPVAISRALARWQLPDSSNLAALAAEQDGVFSRAQARKAGFSYDRISRRIRSGEWVELYGGRALCSAHTILDARGLDRAALLATGARSMLGGPSAARWWAIDVPWPQPFLLVPETSRREPAGITVRRGRVDDADIVLRQGLLLTSRPCTIVDCLRVVPHRTGVDLLDRALLRRWLTFDELVVRTQGLVGRRGCRQARPPHPSRAARDPFGGGADHGQPATQSRDDGLGGEHRCRRCRSPRLRLCRTARRDRDRRTRLALSQRSLPVRPEPTEPAGPVGLDCPPLHLGRPRPPAGEPSSDRFASPCKPQPPRDRQNRAQDGSRLRICARDWRSCG